jgi:hypothetical protein
VSTAFKAAATHEPLKEKGLEFKVPTSLQVG